MEAAGTKYIRRSAKSNKIFYFYEFFLPVLNPFAVANFDYHNFRSNHFEAKKSNINNSTKTQ
eukprot:snap_masked-scaffold_2-processed-gene-26.20-mRNA-1 protein AED:1.00 eAED:1.00 QI:0/0/0/0/1/1/2/0/61